MKKEKLVQYFIIGTFVSLYVIVSIISTIHVIDFFKLSNPDWLAISLAIAFEVGAAASLASLITMDKMNKALIWALFTILTLMQMMGNVYYAYVHLDKYQAWIELFGLIEEEPITQKRIIAIVSGAILPIIALGFIKSLVDYIKPKKKEDSNTENSVTPSNDTQNEPNDSAIIDNLSEDTSTQKSDTVEDLDNDIGPDLTEEGYKTLLLELVKNKTILLEDNTTQQTENLNTVQEEDITDTTDDNSHNMLINDGDLDENLLTNDELTEIKEETQPTPRFVKNPQIRPGVN